MSFHTSFRITATAVPRSAPHIFQTLPSFSSFCWLKWEMITNLDSCTIFLSTPFAYFCLICFISSLFYVYFTTIFLNKKCYRYTDIFVLTPPLDMLLRRAWWYQIMVEGLKKGISPKIFTRSPKQTFSQKIITLKKPCPQKWSPWTHLFANISRPE